MGADPDRITLPLPTSCCSYFTALRSSILFCPTIATNVRLLHQQQANTDRCAGCSRSTACTPLAHDQVAMRQRVKCVMDANGYAIYFSRSTIPGNKVPRVPVSHSRGRLWSSFEHGSQTLRSGHDSSGTMPPTNPTTCLKQVSQSHAITCMRSAQAGW